MKGPNFGLCLTRGGSRENEKEREKRSDFYLCIYVLEKRPMQQKKQIPEEAYTLVALRGGGGRGGRNSGAEGRFHGRVKP